MKIFLVGMPGSGKSTLGRQLSDELSIPFVDLDEEIETREGQAIKDIFALHSEDYFRLVESELLRQLATSPESLVLSTGGGAPCFYEGMQILNENGLTIFLNVSEEKLMKRLQKSKDRPLLDRDAENKQRRVSEMLTARLPIYLKAKLVVTDPDVNRVLKAIRERGAAY